MKLSFSNVGFHVETLCTKSKSQPNTILLILLRTIETFLIQSIDVYDCLKQSKRVSMGLTVNRKTAKNLVVKRKS